MHLECTDRILLFSLLALNSLLKFSWLGVNELAGDEPFTVYWSLRSLPELFHMLQSENNPPLYFLIIKFWSVAVPLDPAWLRVPSALFSALTTVPLFLLARRLGSRTIAVTTTLLFTFSAYHYQFAHEVRAYSLFTLLSVASFAQLAALRERPGPWRCGIAALAVIDALLVYTHFFGWLVVGMHIVCTLALREWRPAHRPALMACAMAALAFAPYATIFFGRAGKSIQEGTWLQAPTWEEPYNMLWRWSNQPVIAVLFLCAIVAGAWQCRLRDGALRLGLFWSFTPLIGMFLISYAVPIYLDRYLVWAAPGFPLAVAAAMAQWTLTSVRHALCALAGAGLLFTLEPWKDNGLHPSRVVAQVDAWSDPHQSVLLFPHHYDLTYAYHRDRQSFTSMVLIQQQVEELNTTPVYTHDSLHKSATDQVLLVRSGDGYPDLFRTLRERFTSVDSIEADHRVWVYRFRR